MIKKLTIVLLAGIISFAPVMPTQKAHASGFPVVDIAHIVQSLVGYVQELADFIEMIQQTALSTEQLIQMVTDYQQVLTEYQHYLDQIRSLRDTIPLEDWERLLEEIERANAQVSEFSLTDLLDAASGSFEEDLRVVLRDQGIAPPYSEEVMDAYTEELGLPGDEAADIAQRIDQLNTEYLRYAAQHERVSGNRIYNEELTEKRLRAESIVNNLGPQSDLQTQQAIAKNQILQMEMFEALLVQQNQMLQHYEPGSVSITQAKSRALEREIQRLRETLGGSNVSDDPTDSFADKYGL